MTVKRIGVVGAGTMGAGIAQLACLGGYEAVLQDPVPEALEAGAERVVGSLAKGVEREKWSAEEAEAAGGRLEAVGDVAELAGCDLVVEAAPEDLELKRRIFADLAGACGPGAILATNTSSLPVTAIGAGTPGPERVLGMHFFNPPALMKLVEVVATADSSEAALEATTEVGRRMGRTPIRAKDSPGFIANRLARPYSLESLRMLADGVAGAEAIDRVCRMGGGFRMGPFELLDLIGLDVNLSVARSFYAQGGEPERWRPSEIQEQMVGNGKLGRKSGAGFYSYGEGADRDEDPDLRLDTPTLADEDLAQIDPAGPEILPRLVAQIANEMTFALEEGVGSPQDMNTAMKLGFNWPLGPVEFAELIGVERAVDVLERLQATHGDAYRPAPGLFAAATRGMRMTAGRKPATDRTAARNREALASLPADDSLEQEEARRGLIAAFDPPRVESSSGRTVWELESYDFLEAEKPPDTAHPSLWRLARLNRIAGLFELAPGFFQLRGFDLSNMHVVEGRDGIVVIDPLVSAEVAAAALALYREHRGDRPVTGLVYTHSHVDHFGGARGILDEREIEERSIPVIAPAGFLHHAVSENVFAGTAMGRRAGYMYGALLGRGADGQLGSGLGMTTSLGNLTLIPPNLEVTETGQEETVDGVAMTFQLTPGSEAPAEMNIHFPEARVLCVADNVARSMHNILTLRGALVRDPRVWAHYIDEAIELYGERSDVLFSGHHWPAWGGERIVDLLEKQRDLYSYLHDQTLRLLNQGLTGPEIAERIELPPGLAAEWHCREYYGSVSHNVKAIYQRYMGWFDGNPAHLWQHEPTEGARRYVEALGGSGTLLARAREAYEDGDYRWVVELVNHLVFAEPENEEARALQADALEQLGYGAENATWRNFFLMGARELREGISGTPTSTAPRDVVSRLSVAQLLDAMAIRLDGPRAGDRRLRIDWVVTEPDEEHRLTLRNGVLSHRPGRHDPAADARLVVDRGALDELLLKAADIAELAGSGRLRVEGDGERLGELLGLLDEPDPGFAIVTRE